jgi:BlaI family transcriptional regulator, penicillinase repressor
MNKQPKITATEWDLMQVVWDAKSPISAFEIIERLNASEPGWHRKTVRALLARLVAKKALGYQAHGRVYFYYPLLPESECVAAASDSFLERVFDGAIEPMLAHFVGRYRLSKKGADELRRLLKEAGTDDKSGKP